MALFSRVHQWVSNEILTSTDLNAEFDNILGNAKASSLNGASASVLDMQATSDPGTVGVEHPATNISGELQQLRFALKRIIDPAGQWYSTPVGALKTGGIPTAAIADGAITQAKRAPLNSALSVSSASSSSNSATLVDVPNLSVTIVTTGRPVMIMLVHDSSGSTATLGIYSSTSRNIFGTFVLAKDGSYLASYFMQHNYTFVTNTTYSAGHVTVTNPAPNTDYNVLSSSVSVAPASFTDLLLLPVGLICYYEVPTAGSHTYKLQYNSGDTNNTIQVNNAKLLVYEL